MFTIIFVCIQNYNFLCQFLIVIYVDEVKEYVLPYSRQAIRLRSLTYHTAERRR